MNSIAGSAALSPLVVVFAVVFDHPVLGARSNEISAMPILLPFTLPAVREFGYDAV